MAIYILAFGTDRPLGSRGGSTFQRAGKSFIIRKRNVPVQKKSPKQTQANNKFDHVQKKWKNLTSGNQTQWEDEAPNYTRTNSLGDPYDISGLNLQASSNINLLNSLEPELTEPANASAIGAPAYGADATAFNSQIISISTFPQIVPAGLSMQMWMSKPNIAHPGFIPTSQMKLIKTWQPGDDSADNIYTEYVEAWSNVLPPVQSIWIVAWRYIQLDTGQVGALAYTDITIVL
jgi:hypothetical protein